MQARLTFLAIAATLSALQPGCHDEPIEATRIQGVTTSYSGIVKGNAYVDAPAVAGGTTKLYVVGMKVELHAKGEGDALAEGVTEEGGRFAINFQHDSDRNELELYLKFVSTTEDGMIRVRKRVLGVKSTRNDEYLKDTPIVVASSSPSVDNDQGEIALDADKTKAHLLHWANRARLFATTELGAESPLPTDPNDPLDIMVPPFGANGSNAPSYFVPDTRVPEIVTLITSGVLVFTIPVGVAVLAYVKAEFSDQDALYIAEGMETDETVFHEFGHYLLWHAQGKKWLNPLKASFASHSYNTNSSNTKIAWTEGFANGFEHIVNSWSSRDDLVGARDDNARTPETPGINGNPTCGAGAGATCNDQGVSHGYFSEFYIESILYDLWDGPSNLDSGPNNSLPVVAADYDDDGVDGTELTFLDLMRPILDTKNGNQASLVDNIVDYYGRLFDLHPERTIKDLFAFDNIRNLHEDAASDYLLRDLLNTDSISAPRSIEVELYSLDASWNLIASTGTKVEQITVDVTRLVGSRDDFNLSSLAVGVVSNTLHDDLVLSGTPALGVATLSFNRNTLGYGFRFANNAYGAPLSGLPTVEPELAVTFAPGMHLEAIDGARVMIGEPVTGQHSTVTVAAGATLTLGGGPGGANPQPEYPGGPMVSKGKLYVHAGSKLIIERGATLEFEKGGEIVLEGPDAELIIRGTLAIRPGATFQWSAINGGMVTFDLASSGGAPNLVMDLGSTFLVHEVPFKIADLTYVRPTDGASREVIMENGAIGWFGTNAYFDVSKATVTLTGSSIQALHGKHLGVILNGNAHTIADMDFSGGARCLYEKLAAGTPLTITDSTFTGCGVGIEVGNRSVGLDHVTITGGTTGLLTTNTRDVGIANSTLSGNTIGWHLVQHGTGTFSLGNTDVIGNGRGVFVDGGNSQLLGTVIVSDSTLAGNGVGLESKDEKVRFQNNADVSNNNIGVRMVGAFAVVIANATTFTGNNISIQLDAAGTPDLDGINGFYPRNVITLGVALSGTIANTQACVMAPTIKVTSDVWFTSAGVGFWLPNSMTTAPYTVTTTGGCVVTLVN